MIWIKTAHNLIVFVISIGALISSLSFVDQVNGIYLEEAPKATQDLQKVFLPPIYRMQWFVFAFDGVCLLYYIYQWPIWDCIKEKFPFFQYEAQSSEKADCTTLLLNVMFNLIDNAMKYAGEDPHIVIRTRQSEVGLSLAVQDNGMGIAKEHLGKVFERLYRVPTGNVHNVKGFGLGLSYVKNVIERHEGSVQIESTPGEGTTLTLNLPFEHQPDKTEET